MPIGVLCIGMVGKKTCRLFWNQLLKPGMLHEYDILEVTSADLHFSLSDVRSGAEANSILHISQDTKVRIFLADQF